MIYLFKNILKPPTFFYMSSFVLSLPFKPQHGRKGTASSSEVVKRQADIICMLLICSLSWYRFRYSICVFSFASPLRCHLTTSLLLFDEIYLSFFFISAILPQHYYLPKYASHCTACRRLEGGREKEDWLILNEHIASLLIFFSLILCVFHLPLCF